MSNDETSVCDFCGKRYQKRGTTRQVTGRSGRSACGWCARWAGGRSYEPLTEEQVLDSAVCRLVGRRTTLTGAATLVGITPFYKADGAEPSSRRWAHVDRAALIADFDRCYPPPRLGGVVAYRSVEREGERKVQGTKRTETYTYIEKLPPEFVPAPPPPLQRSPRRPPTDHERRLAQIEDKRQKAAGAERQRQGRIRKIRRAVAKQTKAIARLEARR